MLRCYNSITIIQQPSSKYPQRNKTIFLDEINKYEVVTGWENQTDTAKVTIPKNIKAEDGNGNKVELQGTNINIGNGDNPLFLRGDRIFISVGYWYLDELQQERRYVKEIFDGYITKVFSKISITLECEDSMWLLKQTPAPDKVWGDNISLQAMLTECIKGSLFQQRGGVVKTQSKTQITFGDGTFFTKGETVSQVLSRIKRDLKIGSYIKNNELRIGYPTYWPSDVQDINRPYQFVFQKNIISDNLQYMRKDDIILSATAQSFYTQEMNTTTKDGATKTETKKLMVFIWADPKTQTFKSKQITDTKAIPINEAGERFTFFFPFSKSIDELTKLAKNELEKRYYTGFKGDFTTFGMPFIPAGDNVKLADKVLGDRDGVYKVKGVTYRGGAGMGHRQQIFIDYKVDL